MKTTSTLLFVLIMLLTGCGNAGKRQTEYCHADTVTLQADTVMPQKETAADTVLADIARHDIAEVSIPVIAYVKTSQPHVSSTTAIRYRLV